MSQSFVIKVDFNNRPVEADVEFNSVVESFDYEFWGAPGRESWNSVDDLTIRSATFLDTNEPLTDQEKSDLYEMYEEELVSGAYENIEGE